MVLLELIRVIAIVTHKHFPFVSRWYVYWWVSPCRCIQAALSLYFSLSLSHSFPRLFPCPHPPSPQPLPLPAPPPPAFPARRLRSSSSARWWRWPHPSDPQETLTITAPPGCLTARPVIPAPTKIAAAARPHILCPLALTYALAAVPVIVWVGGPVASW